MPPLQTSSPIKIIFKLKNLLPRQEFLYKLVIDNYCGFKSSESSPDVKTYLGGFKTRPYGKTI
jgi:hypothetical protein